MAPGDGTTPSAGPPEVGEVAVGDNASMGRSVVEVLQEKKQVCGGDWGPQQLNCFWGIFSKQLMMTTCFFWHTWGSWFIDFMFGKDASAAVWHPANKGKLPTKNVDFQRKKSPNLTKSWVVGKVIISPPTFKHVLLVNLAASTWREDPNRKDPSVLLNQKSDPDF